MVYKNPQGDGLFIVFKYIDEELDTGSYNGSYARKPPARTYNKRGSAKAQWVRFQRDGYQSRAAEIWFEDGGVHIEFIDGDWVLPIQLCRYKSQVANPCGHFWHYEECLRRKGHSGIHWSGKEAKKDPDFDPESVHA
jgi:hypothetical protein